MKKLITLFLLILSFTVSAQKIYFIGDGLTTPTLESSGDNRFGVVLSQAPSATVTVHFVSRNSAFTAPGDLTFTTGNYSTPQEIIIASTTNSVLDLLRYDYLDITCSGGGYDAVTASVNMAISDQNSYHTYSATWGWYGPNWNNQKQWTAKYNQFILDLYNGAGVPSGYTLVGSPTVTNSPGSFALQTGNTNSFSSSLWTKFTQYVVRIVDADGYNYDCMAQLLEPTGTRANKLWVDILGSGETHTEVFNKMLAKGWDILSVSYCPYNSANVTNNPNISPQTNNAAISQLKTGGVERLGFNSYQIITAQLSSLLTKAMELHTYTQVCAGGISGSGFPGLVWSVSDPRVNYYFYTRGSLIREINNQLQGTGGSYTISGFRYGYSTDLSSKQMWDMFKRTTYTDMVGIMVNRGGTVLVFGNTNDGAGSSWIEAGICTNYLKNILGTSAAARHIGVYDNDPSRSTHQWDAALFTGTINGFAGIYNLLGI